MLSGLIYVRRNAFILATNTNFYHLFLGIPLYYNCQTLPEFLSFQLGTMVKSSIPLFGYFICLSAMQGPELRHTWSELILVFSRSVQGHLHHAKQRPRNCCQISSQSCKQSKIHFSSDSFKEAYCSFTK